MGYEFGLSRRIYGVVAGVVTDNKHPDGYYMVKVKFPWIRSTDVGDSENFVTTWARVMTQMAGAGRGFYSLPEPDDEVILSFLHGDIRMPVVLGAVWNNKDLMPVNDEAEHAGLKAPVAHGKESDVGIKDANVDNASAGGKNNSRFFQSRSGHLLIFDDTGGAEGLTIVSKDGHGVTFKDSDKYVSIYDKDGEEYLAFDAANKKITLQSKAGDIDIFCKSGKLNVVAKEIYVESTTKATYKTSADTIIDAGGNVDMDAGGKIDADASKIELN